MKQEIRWEQRFSNFLKALYKLRESAFYIENLINTENRITDSVLEEMLREGVIQRFEYTHELAWNVMKDYVAYQGNSSVGGSHDATREAYKLQLIKEGHVWMDMILSRNKTSHTYNEETTLEIYNKILREYLPALVSFQEVMLGEIANTNDSNLFTS